LSGFIARHIEQPGSRHSKEDLVESLGLGMRLDEARARHDHGVDALVRLPSLGDLRRERRSSIRPLAQEPMKTRSIAMSVSLLLEANCR
jgi:hypothetical protein